MKNRITALLALVAMAGQAQETTGRVMLTKDHGVGSSDHFSN